MSKNVSLYPVLLALVFLVTQCSSAKKKPDEIFSENSAEPGWIRSGKLAKYPESFYLTGVGISSVSLQQADDMARQELAKQVQVRIDGVDEVVISETKEIRKGVFTSTTYSDVQSGIKVRVNQQLEGVRIAERWFNNDKGEHYSFAILDREEGQERLTKKIERARQEALFQYKQGQFSLSEKKYMSALTSFMSGALAWEKAGPDILARRVISPEPATEPSVENPDRKLLGGIQEVVSNLQIRNISDQIPQGKNLYDQRHSLAIGVFYEKGKSRTPVQDAPLLLRFKNKDVIKSHTGPEGLIPRNILGTSAGDRPAGGVTITFDIDEIVKTSRSEKGHSLLKGLAGKRAAFSLSPNPPIPNVPLFKREFAFKALSSRLLSNLDSSQVSAVTCAVIDFVEITSQNRLKFSLLVENELKTALTLSRSPEVQVVDKEVLESLPLAEKARILNVPYIVTGGFVLKKDGIKINAKLIDASTNIILSAAEVMLDRGDAKEMDFIVSGVQYPDGFYPDSVNALFSKKPKKSNFELKMWTDRQVYTVGDPVTIYFSADRDCYLTLLDLGTSGTISYLFPNEFHKNSFVKKGTVYSIPDKKYGFTIKTEGPPGVERIKAIASIHPLPMDRLNLKKGFSSIRPEDGKQARDLRIEVDTLPETGWTEAYHEFFIKPPAGIRYRGLTREIVSKPEKPIDIIGTQGLIEERNR